MSAIAQASVMLTLPTGLLQCEDHVNDPSQSFNRRVKDLKLDTLNSNPEALDPKAVHAALHPTPKLLCRGVCLINRSVQKPSARARLPNEPRACPRGSPWGNIRCSRCFWGFSGSIQSVPLGSGV